MTKLPAGGGGRPAMGKHQVVGITLENYLPRKAFRARERKSVRFLEAKKSKIDESL